jgi:hypothetical protein
MTRVATAQSFRCDSGRALINHESIQLSGVSRCTRGGGALERSEARVPGPERVLERVVQDGHAHGENGWTVSRFQRIC